MYGALCVWKKDKMSYSKWRSEQPEFSQCDENISIKQQRNGKEQNVSLEVGIIEKEVAKHREIASLLTRKCQELRVYSL